LQLRRLEAQAGCGCGEADASCSRADAGEKALARLQRWRVVKRVELELQADDVEGIEAVGEVAVL
jgi:hypothetical protein